MHVKKAEHFSADAATLKMMAEYEQKEHGNGAIAFIPLALVVIPLFFGVNVLYTLLMGWISIAILYWNKIDNKIEILNCGVSDAMGAIVATSAVVGFGGVAKLTAGYTTLVNVATSMGGSPLISFSLGTALLSRRMRFRFRRSDTGSGNTGSKIPGNGYKSWCPSQDRISSLHHTGFPATQRRYGYCTCMLRSDP